MHKLLSKWPARLGLLLGLGVLTTLASQVNASTPSADAGCCLTVEAAKPRELVVGFKHELPYKLTSHIIERNGAVAQAASPHGNLRRLQIPDHKTLSEFAAQLRREPGVDFVEPNYVFKSFATPNDTQYSEQWALPRVSAPAGWDVTKGSDQIKVAVLDTGVDLDHPDLTSRLVPGEDFTQNDSSPTDDNGHGTHIAGIIGATTDNSEGVAGITWNTKIMPIKVLNSRGEGTSWDVSLGIYYAVDNGASIINSSFGSHIYSQALAEAVQYAYEHRRLVVAAAGNDGTTSLNYPAGNDHVLGVGASDSQDRRASFSNHNSSIDVVAPGVDIYSTYKSGLRHTYANGSGSSMAAAFVTGQAALIMGANSTLSPDEVSNIIKSSATDLGSAGTDTEYGSGRINLASSLWIPTGTWVNPNPSSPDFDGQNDLATFVYSLSWPAAMTLRIHNYQGVVKTLVSGYSLRAGDGHFSWTGTNDSGSVLPNGTYRYAVELAGSTGRATYSRTLTLAASKPNISRVWTTPNPFYPRGSDPAARATSVGYTLSMPAWVTIRVYDYRGEVKTVINNTWRSKGRHYEGWPGTNNSGNFLAPGTYKYIISARSTGGLTTASATTTVK